MELIKEFDYQDYKKNGTVGKRPSARAIIIKNGKIALVYSEKYDYYIFAGGGIDAGETKEQALVREVQEELGLSVIPDSIKPYGLIVRKESGMYEDLFIQENYYFVCEVEEKSVSQKLDGYEKEEQYTLRWVTPMEAMEANKCHDHAKQSNGIYCERLMERENWLLQRLIEEGRFA